LASDIDFVVVTARIDASLPIREKIGQVEVVRVGNGNRFDKLHLWWHGWKIVKKMGEFDVIWGIMASYGGLAALRYKKKNIQIPFLLTLQEGDSFAYIYRRAFFVWPWFKQIFTYADRVQTISTYLADWARKMNVHCDINVVPNGVSFPDNQIVETKKTNKKIILSVSRLVEKNGLEYVIKAMSYLPDDYILKIIGNGKLGERLQNMANELGLGDRVEFAGEIANTELPKYYAQATVFCRPSLSEGLGIAFLEAMHQNVPVIATRVGGIPDFLQNGVTGWFCNLKDPADIAKKIIYVCDEKNASSVARVRAHARQMIREKFSWTVVSEKIKNIFFDLCES
jgi:glycosyltransferase involved in cell wall biosynthesis